MKMRKIIMLSTLLALFAGSIPVQANVVHPSSTSVETFKKEISEGIVILDFFATWCGPCKKFAPAFTKASSNFPNIKFIKVDVEQYNAIAKWCGVRKMPTIMMFKDGKKVAVNIGSMSYSAFTSWIKNSL